MQPELPAEDHHRSRISPFFGRKSARRDRAAGPTTLAAQNQGREGSHLTLRKLELARGKSESQFGLVV